MPPLLQLSLYQHNHYGHGLDENNQMRKKRSDSFEEFWRNNNHSSLQCNCTIRHFVTAEDIARFIINHCSFLKVKAWSGVFVVRAMRQRRGKLLRLWTLITQCQVCSVLFGSVMKHSSITRLSVSHCESVGAGIGRSESDGDLHQLQEQHQSEWHVRVRDQGWRVQIHDWKSTSKPSQTNWNFDGTRWQ